MFNKKIKFSKKVLLKFFAKFQLLCLNSFQKMQLFFKNLFKFFSNSIIFENFVKTFYNNSIVRNYQIL